MRKAIKPVLIRMRIAIFENVFKKIKNKKIIYYVPLFLLWLALFAIFFSKEGFLFFGDFNPAFSKAQFLYTWYPKDLGFDYSSYLFNFFYWSWSNIMFAVFGLEWGTKLIFLLPLLYFSSVIYWILSFFGLKPRNCFLLGALALMNPLTLGYLLHGGVDVTFIGFSNIIIAFFFLYRALSQKKLFNKYLVLSVIFASFTSYIVYFFIFLILLTVFFITELFFTKHRIALFKSAALYFVLVFMVNAYWLAPFLYSIVFQNGEETILPSNSGTSVVRSLTPFSKIINILSLHYYGALQDRLGFGIFLDLFFVTLIGGIVYLLFIYRSEYLKRNRGLLCVLIVFLVSVFFATGPNAPFGNVFLWLFENVPFFKGLRTFIRFNIVIFICYIAFVAFMFDKYKKERKIEWGISVFVVIMITYFGSHFVYLPQNKIQPIRLPDGYRNIIENRGRLDSNSVDAPFHTYNEEYTWGVTSLMSHLFERYFWYGYIGYVESDSMKRQLITLYNTGYKDNKSLVQIFRNLNSILNIKNIVFHKDKLVGSNQSLDVTPHTEMMEKMRDVDVIGLTEENPNFNYYRIAADYFLPHFYTPSETVIADGDIQSIANIISNSRYKTRSAFYLKEQGSQNHELINQVSRFYDELPLLEFKRINPTKYKIRVHAATESFPLVFSETFNNGWKVYAVNPIETQSDMESEAARYKILEGNENDQASQKELLDFIDSGWISTLGDKKEKRDRRVEYKNGEKVRDDTERYTIDFISKNFQGTIQNDNLPAGRFYDTWRKQPLSSATHGVANGYANSWIIDPKALCIDNKVCTSSGDGVYDFELTVEFWPQRVFYAGLIISGIMIAAGFVYILVARVRKRHKVEGKEQ